MEKKEFDIETMYDAEKSERYNGFEVFTEGGTYRIDNGNLFCKHIQGNIEMLAGIDPFYEDKLEEVRRVGFLDLKDIIIVFGEPLNRGYHLVAIVNDNGKRTGILTSKIKEITEFKV